MTKHPVEELRNIVLVGHGATGKTSLADLMLFKAGIGRRAGSPDEGTSLLDIDDDEKQRHHSITSHVCHFEHQGARLNVIDAPGMPDFVGQVIGAYRAAETVLITVNAPHGIEVNTRKSFQHAGHQGLARCVVLNKCDAENVHLPELMQDLREQFGAACALMTIPLGTGAQIHGVLETVHLPEELPADAAMDPRVAHQQLLDAAVEADEDLMIRYLEGEEFTASELDAAIGKAIVKGTLIPVFCTAVKADIGVAELMNALAKYAPSPAQLKRHVLKNGKDIEFESDPLGPLVAQVIKTRMDPFLSKISYLRVYSGTLKKESSVHLVGTNKSVRIHHLADVQGNQHESVEEAIAGNLVAVTKVDELHTGDVISDGSDAITMPPMAFPRPMIGLAVEPKSQADQAKISTALHKIEEEDPTFRVHREEQTHEMVIEGMSELHLQLIQNRLHNREKVDIVTHLPRIPYRETVLGTAEGSYRHKKQSGGSGQFAEVHMRVSSCPVGINPDEYFVKERFPNLRTFHYDPTLNACYIDRITGGSVPNQFIPAVEKGVRERMTHGIVAGCQVQNVVVELFFGKDHPVDSNEAAFKTAASMCLKEIFPLAKPSLLEPIVKLEITVPTARIGDITGDLNTRRGHMEGMEEIAGGYTMILARAPLSEVMTYARSLSSMTGGQGSFTMEFSNYETVPANEQLKIIATYNKGNSQNGNGHGG
ncbi:elongation factor G [Planctomicrobium piriforme]|uniref:Elongation factor G n=1 Tax=Planctomicrobium piriforme TaxID=1576369 RepID=A0A1I3JVF8_9PLAN|nr:elongation factor G [Planctomicrobium piriforme]SFI64259.1 elongation factor G [Planctomicrobium piriforme]